jgi:hypothetical protein
MCTVSVIKLSGLLRLVSNRDERRTRPTALPPAVTHAGGLRIIAPTDPASQGTWIACSETGLAIALLNVNPPEPDGRVPPRSRGTIIPALIRSRSLDEVAARAGAVEHGDYAPYRLVAIHAGEDDVLETVPMSGVIRRWPLDAPRMFTSSGLGDHHVESQRRQLFEETVLPGEPADWRERQDRFHAHRWRDRLSVSVHMARTDAWTVSRTAVEIAAARIVMSYAAEPDWTTVVTILTRASPAERAGRS